MKNLDWQYALHERFCAGEPTASAEIFDKIITPLIPRLTRQYPGVPAEDVEDMVLDVFLSYIQNPSQYEPKRGKTLSGYLQMAASGDIKNYLASPGYSRTVPLPDESGGESAVDMIHSHRNLYTENNFVDTIASADVANQLLQMAMGALQDPVDQSLLNLILNGNHDMAEYARILNIEHHPEDEKRAIIKRNTDRIKKTLRRLSEKAKGIVR